MTSTAHSSLKIIFCTYIYILFHNITQFSGHEINTFLRDHTEYLRTTETAKSRHSHVNRLRTSSDSRIRHHSDR